MKRVAIVYFSQSGECQKVAGAIRERLPDGWAAEMVRIQPTDPSLQLPVPLQPFWPRFLSTLRPSIEGRLVPVVTEPAEPTPCDLVFVGGPTWWGHTSIPLNSYLHGDAAKRLIAGKPVGIFAGCRGVYEPNLANLRARVEALGGHVVTHEKYAYTGTTLTTYLSFFSYLMTGKQRETWLGVHLTPYGFTPETLGRSTDFVQRTVAGADKPAPTPARDPVSTAPGLWVLLRTLFAALAIFDILLAATLIFWGRGAFALLGQPQFAVPRFFELCVAAFLLEYVWVQGAAAVDPRANSTCATMTVWIRLTFPVMYMTAVLLWGSPWTIVHTLFCGSAALDLLAAGSIILLMRRFGIALLQGDTAAERPAPDSPWLRRILLVLGTAEFCISWNWMLAPKLWMGLFDMRWTVDPFWTRATGAFLLNIALIQFLGFVSINRYRTAVITSGVFRALWPPLYWYWCLTGGEGNTLFKVFILFFSFFDLASCITIFTLLSRAAAQAEPAERVVDGHAPVGIPV
jgi:hypothetical protein